jgi:hypothetical protein
MAETTQGLSVLEWACERLANTQRIAAEKTGEDRIGWLIDQVYWQQIVAALSSLSASPEAQGWQPIATAPVGSWPNGPNDTRDPAYVEPPKLWLALEDGLQCVGYFDAYYAEGGNGYDGQPPWVEQFSGERIRPTYWMSRLPSPPEIPR